MTIENPEPIEDSPAICETCSALGGVPHQCDDTESCPCGSPLCGAPAVAEAGDHDAGD